MQQSHFDLDILKNALRGARPKKIFIEPKEPSDLYNKKIYTLFPAAKIQEKSPRHDTDISIFMLDSNTDETLVKRALQLSAYVVIIKYKSARLPGFISAHAGSALNKKLDVYLYSSYRLQPLFREPVGKPVLKSLRPFLGKTITEKISAKLPFSSLYSPYELLIYEKSKNGETTLRNYRRKTSLDLRLRRAYTRLAYRLQNHRINDYYNSLKLVLRLTPVFGKRSFSKHFLNNKNTHSYTPDKNRVGIITGQLAVGGVEQVLLDICKVLKHSGKQVFIYTTSWNANLWEQRFKEHSVQIHHIPKMLGHGWPSKYYHLYLTRLIQNDRIGRLLISNSEPGYEALPAIVSSHKNIKAIDLLHTHGAKSEKDAFLRISAPYDRYLTYRVTINQYLASYMNKKYPVSKEKIHVIYNSIPLKHVRAKKSYHENRKLFVYVGRLQEDKSPERLVMIADRLKYILDKHGAAIAIYGDGKLKDELIALSKKHGTLNQQVFFFGYTNEPLTVFRQAYFSLITSNLEGLPMSVLESMSVGTPAICSSVGGIPEIISDGSDGYLVKFDQKKGEASVIEAFSQKITRALELPIDQYELMSHSASDRISTTFSDTQKQYLSLLD